MTESELRPLVRMLAEKVQSIFEQPITFSEAEIARYYDQVVAAFHQLNEDEKASFVSFLLGWGWMARYYLKELSIASNTELPRMWT